MTVSMCIITGTCIYLRYKIINLNRTFKSVKRSSAEEQAAVKAGRLVEILQEQVKPTFTVFMAGGIDVVFSLSPIALFILRRIVNFDAYFKIPIVIMQLSQYFSHAVVYAVHDNDIQKKSWKFTEISEAKRKAK